MKLDILQSPVLLMKEDINLLITFSGGETSALMTKLLLTKYKDVFNKIVVVFCNTSQENEGTLDFVKKCDDEWGFNTVWLEGVPQHGKRVGTKHRVVDYKSAKRNGEVFEDMVKKYGIPNHAYPHCTRELKLAPIKSYLIDLGWLEGDHVRAIGIRADETRRISKIQNETNVIYPMNDFEKITKPDVNTFFDNNEFRLVLTGYQGNCKTCWKKSMRKLMTIMDETPEMFDFFDRVEQDLGDSNTTGGFKRVFFRGNLSTNDLREIDKRQEHTSADDDSVVYNESVISWELGDSDGCVEHCEVEWD